jgi:hypothetical protein
MYLRVGFDLERIENHNDRIDVQFHKAVACWRENIEAQKKKKINTTALEYAIDVLEGEILSRPKSKNVTQTRQAVLLRQSLRDKYPHLKELPHEAEREGGDTDRPQETQEIESEEDGDQSQT